MTWKYLCDCVTAHWASITFFGGLVCTAAVKTMPPPGVPFNRAVVYTWMYDFLHQFLNTNNNRLNSQPTLTPPLMPPQTTGGHQ